jgi:hypothetical protein
VDVDRQSICRLITVGQKLCESNRNTDDQASGHPHTQPFRRFGRITLSGRRPSPRFSPVIRADPPSAFPAWRAARWASFRLMRLGWRLYRRNYASF